MPKEKPSRVIVTGGAGFIGSHLVEYLLNQDIEVTVIDNLSTGFESNLSGAKVSNKMRFFRKDLAKDELDKQLFEDIDIVYHLAASVGVKLATRYPATVMLNNLISECRLIKRCALSHVSRLIFASSSEVYGNTNQTPSNEDDPIAPVSAYGMSKIAGESLCKAFNEEFGLKSSIVRYFNVYGPRQDIQTKSWVIPNFMCNALSKKPLIIHGKGNQTRDFTYVEDAIAGTYLASLHGKGNADVYNIGTGKETSINELAEIVKEVTNTEGIVTHSRDRKFKISRRSANINKAHASFSYTPQVSLREGLRKSLHYYKSALQKNNI